MEKLNIIEASKPALKPVEEFEGVFIRPLTWLQQVALDASFERDKNEGFINTMLWSYVDANGREVFTAEQLNNSSVKFLKQLTSLLRNSNKVKKDGPICEHCKQVIPTTEDQLAEVEKK